VLYLIFKLSKSNLRFSAIDVFRGISILYMIIGHTSEFWLYNSELWFRGVLFVIMDVIGANAFIMLAGIGLSLSYHSQMRRIQKNPMYPRGYAKINFWSRTIVIGLIAILTNILGTFALENPTGWIWLVLQTIAFGRIICYPFMKYNWKIRATIGIAFFLMVDLVRSALLGFNPVLYYIFFNVNEQNTPFPFFGFLFLGSALGDWFDSIMNQNTNQVQVQTKKSILNLTYFIIIGAVFISIGIISGLGISNDGYWGFLVSQINLNSYMNISGLPLFLCRNSIPWCFYSFGFEILFLTLLLYIDRRRGEKTAIIHEHKPDPRMIAFNESQRKSKVVSFTLKDRTHKIKLLPLEKLIILRNRFPTVVKDSHDRGITLLGKRSMTLYLVHFILYATIAVRNSLSVPFFLLAYLGFVIFLYYLMRLWLTYGREVMTFEWIMQNISTWAENIYDKYRLKSNARERKVE
jgi:uncharacterized membrane protein